MLYSTAGIFVSVFMLDKGYTNSTIGLVIALGSVLAIFLETGVANITDKIQRITNITVMKTLIAVMYVLVIAILLIGEKSLALTIAYIALIIGHTTMHPFVNALSFYLSEGGHNVSYGLGRSMGSLAGGTLAFVMGYLVSWFSPNMIMYVGLINLTIMTIAIFITEKHYKQVTQNGVVEQQQEEEVEAIGLAEFVQRNKVFMIMSLGIVLLFFGNVIVENFTIQIVENIGGNTEQMGFVIFLLSIFEMPAMLGFNRLKEKFSYVFLLRVAAVFFSLKIIMMFIANNMFMIYLAQLNQVLGYGLLFPALVSFIDHIMDKREAVRGQAVFTVALTVGNVFGSVLGGIILDAFSVTTLLGISSVLSVIGTLIIVALINRIKH
ncbi:MAG: MFS transporter [Firmicutes bacterium]|nr:MFS transporter [Bacillota bacterium]